MRAASARLRGRSLPEGVAADAIMSLKITLEDVDPPVVRKLDVPASITLARLHQAIQAAMGWEDRHLYLFEAGRISWGPDPDFDPPVEVATRWTLIRALEATGRRTLTYVYDLGDSWLHKIAVGRPAPPRSGISYPLLIAAANRCPPEDSGGAYGYAELRAALADPTHESHTDALEMLGEHFDPHDEQGEHLAARVQTLARRWAMKAARPKRPKSG